MTSPSLLPLVNSTNFLFAIWRANSEWNRRSYNKNSSLVENVEHHYFSGEWKEEQENFYIQISSRKKNGYPIQQNCLTDSNVRMVQKSFPYPNLISLICYSERVLSVESSRESKFISYLNFRSLFILSFTILTTSSPFYVPVSPCLPISAFSSTRN